MDFFAIFPYYLERYDEINGLLSLRLLRMFRVFQLLRLGQYNVTFMSLTNVLFESMASLNILIIVLVFGAAFFGSIIYFMEKGDWKYTTYTDPPSYMFVRMSADGVSEEPTPFTSIPVAFWWFIVTATTVGYGDIYPTSIGGKVVGTAAMLTGVLVIAFPVSIFSDLWSKELKKAGALDHLESESIGDLDDDFNDKSDDQLVVKPKDEMPTMRKRAQSNEFSIMGFPDPIREFMTKQEAGKIVEKLKLSSSDHTKETFLSDDSDDKVPLNQSDVDAIYQYMALIEDNQRQIQESQKQIHRLLERSLAN